MRAASNIRTAFSLSVVMASFAVMGCVEDLSDASKFEGKLSVDSDPRVPNRPPRLKSGDKPSGGGKPMPTATSTGSRPQTPPPTQVDAGDKDGGGNDLLPAVCGDVPRDILANPKNCGGASCHGSEGEPPSPGRTDLGSSPDDTFERMLGFKMSGGACDGQVVINASDPKKSLLLTKLSDPAPCGLVMPFPIPGIGLSTQEKECIELWVEAELRAAK